MNEQINAQALAVVGALAKLNSLGIKVIGVYLDNCRYQARFHLHGEFDPNVFNATVTTDRYREGKYIEHNCIFEGVEVFWLEEKEQVAA